MYEYGIIQPAADLSCRLYLLPLEPWERAKAIMILGVALIGVLGEMM